MPRYTARISGPNPVIMQGFHPAGPAPSSDPEQQAAKDEPTMREGLYQATQARSLAIARAAASQAMAKKGK